MGAAPTPRSIEPARLPRQVLVMGVSGCGKSSVGSALAERLGWRFVDADDYHPAANVDKMRAGLPLDDQDRAPWLDRLNALLRHSAARDQPVVLACSALRERYRERLSHRLPGLAIVHLRGDFDTIAARLAARTHRYMPPTLLRSQFDTLESPGPPAIDIDIGQSLEAIVATLFKQLSIAGN